MSQVRSSDLPQIKHRMIALAVASACATMVPAFAQQNPQSPTTDLSQPQAAAPAQTVVVTGIRASMQSTLNLKKNSDGIVDGIVADDIGKFPDTNLAEAVQRISGVSIDRQNGEGSRVTIRGVGPDLNLILLNGRQMPTSSVVDRGSRSFDFSNLASEAVSQIQVYKSSRADIPTGGMGATLNIMTGRPLDLGNQTSIGAKAVYDRSNVNLPSELAGSKITPEVSTLISRKFGTNDMFGLSLTASYQKRNSGQNDARITDGWLGPLDANARSGDGSITPASVPNTQNIPTSGIYMTPQNLSYFLNGVQRQRTNGQLTFQFRPIKDWTTTVDYTYARNKVQTLGNELNVWYNHNDTQASTWKNGPVNSPLVYEERARATDFSMNGHKYATIATLKSTGFNTQYRVNPDLKLSFDAHHSISESGSDGPLGVLNNLATAARGRNTNGIIFGQEMPIFYQDFDPTQPFQPTGSWFQDAHVKQTINQYQASGALRIGESSNLNFGLSSTKVKLNSAYQQVMNAGTWDGVSPGTSQQDARKYFDQSFWKPFNYRKYFSQLGGSGDPRLYDQAWIVDFDKVRQAAMNLPAGSPGSGNIYTASLSDPTEVRDLKEKSNALFAQLTHEWDTALPMHTGIGLRYEKTKVTARADIAAITGVTWTSQNEFSVERAANTTPEIINHDYHYWLPSVDWDMDAFDNVKLRASYSTNIGRARWDQLANGRSQVGNVGRDTGIRLREGNPALNPVKAKNIDLSVEWYYTKQSMVSLGLFHKSLSGYAGSTVKNEISPIAHWPIGGAYYREAQAAKGCTATQTECFRDYILTTLNGRPGVTFTDFVTNADGTHARGSIVGQPGDPFVPFTVSSIANQKDATLKGAEINLQHMFNNGFGIQGNYTYVKTDIAYDNARAGEQFALLGQSNSANLVGIYEDQKWSVRLAYNWRGQFLSNTDANGRNNPEYTEPYGQVDLSVGYNVSPNLSVSLEGINLTSSTQRLHGRDDLQVVRVSTGGQRWMLGARYKF